MSDRIEYRHPNSRIAGLPGPWADEPDKVQWYDDATGLPCLIVRNGSGALCGYVAVDEAHPWFGIEYSGCTSRCGEAWCSCGPEYKTTVHGGLTYSGLCSPGADEGHGICHVPRPGAPDRVWWFGFDCAHSGDRTPLYDSSPWRDVLGDAPDGDTYRDVGYVSAEVESLAAQLAAVK